VNRLLLVTPHVLAIQDRCGADRSRDPTPTHNLAGWGEIEGSASQHRICPMRGRGSEFVRGAVWNPWYLQPRR
jgi:hypothetical protein